MKITHGEKPEHTSPNKYCIAVEDTVFIYDNMHGPLKRAPEPGPFTTEFYMIP